MKKALITGITGQDGSYLAEFLLEKGYEVHGITRRASLANTARIEHIMDKITLHDGDLSDSSSLIRIINIVQPDEIYNLAAQSHVQVSFDVPEYSGDVDALGVLRILEACRLHSDIRSCKHRNLLQLFLCGWCFLEFPQLFRLFDQFPAARDNSVPPIQPVCCCKAVWLLDRERVS